MSSENTPMVIGEDWFCYQVDCDCEKPYIVLCHKETSEEEKVLVPEQLAYYLRTHFCGSEKMHNSISNSAASGAANEIRKQVADTLHLLGIKL